MCLHYVETDISKKRWLGKQPKNIIAYKIMRKKRGKYYPLFTSHGHGFDSFFPRRMNRIKGNRTTILSWFRLPPGCHKAAHYAPEYHLFRYKKNAFDWGKYRYAVIVKCEIPKKDITEVGTQDGFKVIVTKAFKIVEEIGPCYTGGEKNE